MKKKKINMLAHDIPLRFVKVLNIICITIPFVCCWYGYYSRQMKDSFYNKGNLLMIALFMLVYFLFARIYNAFLVSVNRISEMVYSQVLAAMATDGISYGLLLKKDFSDEELLNAINIVFSNIERFREESTKVWEQLCDATTNYRDFFMKEFRV